MDNGFRLVAENLHRAMKALFADEKPLHHKECSDGMGICAWCYAEEEMEKAETAFAKEKLQPPAGSP